LEVCRWCQASFLSADKRMKSSSSSSSVGGAAAQSVALMDELGSVTHIFSDKTGTLTQNLMQFRCLGIQDRVYGYDEFEEEARVLGLGFGGWGLASGVWGLEFGV